MGLKQWLFGKGRVPVYQFTVWRGDCPWHEKYLYSEYLKDYFRLNPECEYNFKIVDDIKYKNRAELKYIGYRDYSTDSLQIWEMAIN